MLPLSQGKFKLEHFSYAQPTSFSPDALNFKSGAIEDGDFYANIDGDILGTLSGQSINLAGQNWGLWRTGAGGTYEDLPLNNWNAVIASSGDSAPWVAVMSGAGWAGNEFSATITGVNLYGTSLGWLSGNVIGDYGDGSWEALALGTYEEMVDLTKGEGGITEINIAGNGLGNIDGVLMAGLVGGQVLETTPDTGTFSGILAGTGNITGNSNWRLALGVRSYDEKGVVDGYLLGTADSSSGFQSVSFGPDTDTFTLGRVDGTVSDITNVDTTWNANVTGKWIDLAELDPDILGFDNVALAAMVDVPITETYASLLEGTGGITGQMNITDAVMDISFYTGGSEQIWAALINGNYTGTGADGWALTLTGNGYTADFTDTTWNPDNSWTAAVDGTSPDISFTGQAGGTYDASTFTGVGAGTWEQTPPGPQ